MVMVDMAVATRQEEDEGLETMLATPQENDALRGALDVTPTFSIDLPGGIAAVFPMGFYSWPEIDASRVHDVTFRATSISPSRSRGLYRDPTIESMSQTLTQSGSSIGVIPLLAWSFEGIGTSYGWKPSVVEEAPSAAQSALEAVADIQRWLAIGQDQVATLAGYAPRSVKNWREGMDPYPSTVRRLFDLHALLGSLTHRIGVEGARLWLADISHTGVRRRDRLADEDGLRSVISEAATTLFEQPSVLRMHALDFEESPEPEVPRRPGLFSGPVRRARRRT
ncbi:MAG: hypothetical protein ACYC1D_16705 [Acidimicrobiales bacterium]